MIIKDSLDKRESFFYRDLEKRSELMRKCAEMTFLVVVKSSYLVYNLMDYAKIYP